ncbi:unnamed protein product, partial [Phaeothamnion confervicola]
SAARAGTAAATAAMPEPAIDVSGLDEVGRTPLHLAVVAVAAYERAACVKLLLQAGADPNALDSDGHRDGGDGATPLHAAAGNGNADMVALLLRHGANLDAVDADGQTPLMYAAAGNHGGAIAALLEGGGTTDSRDENDRTVLHLAAEANAAAALTALLTHAMEVDAVDVFGETALHAAIASAGFAATAPVTTIVRALLQAGADPNLQTREGDNAAHLAAR